MLDHPQRSTFLNLAALVEGGLFFAALGLGWLVGVQPLKLLTWDLARVGWGLAATAPMFAFFVVSYYVPRGPLLRIKELLISMLGPLLSVCRWYDLIVVALLAGIGEEFLFRGVLQTWLGRWDPVAGFLITGLIFGLAHFISPLYALLASLAGFYLGWLFDPNLDGEGHLLAPIIAHGLYDYLAFLIVVREYRRRHPPDAQKQVDDA
jgi:membrane protease YdiL (CAAX protease family)